MTKEFDIQSRFKPSGDQPKAIEKLIDGIKKNNRTQTLIGATGTGKTFTVANVIQEVKKPTLVMAHNKTLAAQLCNELKEFFPNNAVEYFISYYDFYRPEAYLAKSDTYIEKSAVINDEIDRLRHSATRSLIEREDVIVVASVSCIYGLGMPEDYLDASLKLQVGQEMSRSEILKHLIFIQYERNDLILERGKFRAKGDVVEIYPPYEESFIRIELFGDEIEKISIFDPVSSMLIDRPEKVAIYPSRHFVMDKEKLDSSLNKIEKELEETVNNFKNENKLVEAQRIEQRTKYDLEMLREVGYCQGIENYSRHLTDRKEGSCPSTLMDYFPKDFLIIIDESHVSIPQIKAMYNGDRARKQSLVDYGFRLPSALDNRPLKWEEFWEKINQVIFVSATPSEFELKISENLAEQIIRPTGLVDPEIIIKPTENQIDDLINEIKHRVEKKQRILVTTLTKKMAEHLSKYLGNLGIKVEYLHSDVKSIDRVEIIGDLRKGEFDVLVGVNLLREGLDLPEVSLVAILDADKEGFLRSDKALIQTIGRTARNVDGKVIMYADKMTDSMKRAYDETNRRRNIQLEYNRVNNITPVNVEKSFSNPILEKLQSHEKSVEYKLDNDLENIEDIPKIIIELEIQMKKFAKALEFEKAGQIRDKIFQLKKIITQIN